MKPVSYPLVRQFVLSTYMDVFGAAVVVFVCFFKNFHRTIYYQGGIQFDIPIENLLDMIQQGAFPLGIFSMIAAVFSLMATRLTGKQSNWGNFIGLLTTISSGALDYLFGNASAIITYPLTFLIFSVALVRWGRGERIRKRDLYYYLIIIAGLIVGFALVYLGAYLFGGRTDPLFLNVVALTFGLSLGGNFCNAFKYEETWLSWVVYNIVQLAKAVIQFNIANVAKYIFYLFNAALTLFDWRFNGDKVSE